MKVSSFLTLYQDPPGTKPVLVLGNSLGAGVGMWAAQLPAWQEKYRVIRFDYPGHNGTDCPDNVIPAVDVWADELLNMLSRLGVEKFTYAGVSLGGMLGLRLAAAAPDRVQRLVFANARFFQEEAGHQQWSDRIQQVTEQGRAAMEMIADATITRWLSEEFRMRKPDVSQALRQTLALTEPSGYIAGATVVRDYDARPFLEAVRCPTLLIAGSEDVAAPADHVQALAALLPAARAEVIAGSAHLSNVDSAETFTRVVDEFLLHSDN